MHASAAVAPTISPSAFANVQSALCYAPVAFMHLIVPPLMLAHPLSSRLVRFHAVQSLVLGAAMLGSMLVLVVFGGLLVPIGLYVLLSIVDGWISDHAVMAIVVIGTLGRLLAFAGAWLLGVFWAVGSLVFTVGQLAGLDLRVPILASLVDRWVGRRRPEDP